MWLPAARMELLMATASPRALDTVPSQQPACGDQISLPSAGLSRGVPHQHGGAGRQRLTVTCAGYPAPRGPPLPILGHLISTLLAPSWQRGGTHGGDSKGQESKPWVSKGFAGSKSSSPAPPAGWEGSPCPGAVPTGLSPALPGGSDRCTHWEGSAQTDVTRPQLDTGEWSPSLRHQRDPDLSHSFRLSLQHGG